MDWSQMVTKIETVFFYLIKKGSIYGFDVNSILAIPASDGSTCFSIASDCSETIMKYIIDRNIDINSINTLMMVPSFKYSELAVQMMTKNVNPHVIAYNGKSSSENYQSSFINKEARKLLAEFQRSIHFSIEDINCDDTCLLNCLSNYRKFYFKNGELLQMTDKFQIGQGGFGSVFKGFFHGQQKAFKCVPIGQLLDRDKVKDMVSDLEKNISEIRIQMATAGSGVIVPEAFVRQQIQRKDKNKKWIAENYNVYVYPLYDCNLYELHEKYFGFFTEEITGTIINQCFIRKRF